MARVSNRPRYWLTLCVQMPGQQAAVTVIEDSTQDLDRWLDSKPQAPKGALSAVKVRLTVRAYRAGDIVTSRDAFNIHAAERFRLMGFVAIPEIPADEMETRGL